jgi:hypothetical protein
MPLRSKIEFYDHASIRVRNGESICTERRLANYITDFFNSVSDVGNTFTNTISNDAALSKHRSPLKPPPPAAAAAATLRQQQQQEMDRNYSPLSKFDRFAVN